MKLATIVYNYNRANFIRRCLSSILEQKGNIQNDVIVFDLSSTDNSLEIIQEFSDVECIRLSTYYGMRGKLLPIGMNRWLSVQYLKDYNYDYVCIVDSDDYWREDKLQEQVKLLNRNPNLKYIFSDSYYVTYEKVEKFEFPVAWDEDVPIVSDGTFHDKYSVPSGGSHFINLLTKYNYMPSPSSMYNYKTLMAINTLPTNFTSGVDYLWLLKVASMFGDYIHMNYIKEPLVYYSLHDDQFTKKNRTWGTMEEIEIVKQARELRGLSSFDNRKVNRHLMWLYTKLLLKEMGI